MTKHFKHPTVAVYLTRAIAASGKLQREIAQDLGYDHPNVVTMIKQGKTKLPINKIGPIAKALDLDPMELLQIAMAEYMPDTWDAIKDIISSTSLSADERRLLIAYRQLMIQDA